MTTTAGTQPGYQTIQLRIRKSSRLEINIDVTNHGKQHPLWNSKIVAVWRIKPKQLLFRSFAAGGSHATEADCIEAACDEAWQWVRSLQLPSRTKRSVLLDIEDHATKLLGRPFAPNFEGYVQKAK